MKSIYSIILLSTILSGFVQGQNLGDSTIIESDTTITHVAEAQTLSGDTSNNSVELNQTKFRLKNSELISLFALIVSGLALFISYLTYKIQRLHNIKSLRPYIVIHPYDYEDRIKIELKNQGMGVAIIKEISVLKLDESKPNIFKWLPEKLPDNMNYEDYFIGQPEFAVSPDLSLNLLEISFDKSIAKQIKVRNDIRKILGELSIQIQFTDVYDNNFTFNKDLTFFNRTDNVNSTGISLIQE